MRICIRTRVMRLMLDRAYAYAYGRLYIYGLLALEIDQSSQSTSQRSIQSNNMPYATNSVTCKIDDPEHATGMIGSVCKMSWRKRKPKTAE